MITIVLWGIFFILMVCLGYFVFEPDKENGQD
jgi:preprotein translocase subunit SecG